MKSWARKWGDSEARKVGLEKWGVKSGARKWGETSGARKVRREKLGREKWGVKSGLCEKLDKKIRA